MANINYNQLTEEKRILKTCSPLLASSSYNPDQETKESIFVKQEKFLSLSKKNRDKLASIQIVQKIHLIGQKYGFELLRLANITRLIREYYFGEVRFEDFPKEIERRMGVSLLTAQEITRYLKQEIIDWDPWTEYIARLPKLSIREIAEKYPKIGHKEITAGHIELKGSDELEEPTIKNWIQDYIKHLGYEKHSQMQRTEYLFHSENGKELSALDRKKVGIVLKSFDENIPLPVDEENEEIVFDAIVSDRQPTNSEQQAAINNQYSENISRPQSDSQRQDSFIKPYEATPRPQKQAPRPAPAPTQSAPTLNYIKPKPPVSTAPPAPTMPKKEIRYVPPAPQPRPAPNVPHNFASQTGIEEINKYFSVPESADIPPMKIHSITEHGKPKTEQQTQSGVNIKSPAPPEPESAPRPKHKIIDPFIRFKPEPKIEGNIVDLSGED